MQELVYVCSPLRGDISGNIRQGTEYCFAVASCGDVPIAPHVYFTRFLRDGIHRERELGINMGLVLLHRCDRLAVFLKNGISEGMWGEINAAKEVDMPIDYYRDETEYVERNQENNGTDPLR